MQIHLTPEQARIVSERMKTGARQTARDGIDEALRRAQLDRGDGVPWDAAEFVAEGQRRRAERRATPNG